jgi:hypothetical protein
VSVRRKQKEPDSAIAAWAGVGIPVLRMNRKIAPGWAEILLLMRLAMNLH